MKRIALFALVALMLLSLVSCGDKTLEKNGFTITLPSNFVDMTSLTDGVVANYATLTGDMVVTALKNSFADIGDSTMTAREFAELLIDANGFDSEIKQLGDSPYFVYDYDVEGVQYTYLAFTYVGGDGYWFVTFACPSDKFESKEAKMLEYAKTIVIE